MKRNFGFLICLILLSRLVAGCGDSSTPSAASSTTVAASTAGSSADSVKRLKDLGSNLTVALEAGAKNDFSAARTAYKKFEDGWFEVEVAVKNVSKDLYRDIEEKMTVVGRELVRNEKPAGASVKTALEGLQQKYNSAITAVQNGKPAANTPKFTPISGAEVEAATARVSQYLKGQADKLVNSTTEFTNAVKSRDIAKAKNAYLAARFDYESIEFLAESFTDLDVAIDARPDDFPQGEKDEGWTGFHPLEKAIYVDGKLDERTDKLAAKLLVDVTSLREQIKTMKIDPETAINGAAELIEEIQSGKITGEEERYSRTDFNDLRANFESAKFVYETYAPFIKQRNATLDTEIRGHFSTVEKSLATYFTNGQVMDYSKIDDNSRKQLAQKVEALADAYSRVSGTLGLKL